jgi:hypothetical protein
VEAAKDHAWLAGEVKAVTGESLATCKSPKIVPSSVGAKFVQDNRSHLETWRHEAAILKKMLDAPFQPPARVDLGKPVEGETAAMGMDEVHVALERMRRLLALRSRGWEIVDRIDAPEFGTDIDML